MAQKELDWIEPYCNKEKDNVPGSFIAHLYQFIECKLTQGGDMAAAHTACAIESPVFKEGCFLRCLLPKQV